MFSCHPPLISADWINKCGFSFFGLFFYILFEATRISALTSTLAHQQLDFPVDSFQLKLLKTTRPTDTDLRLAAPCRKMDESLLVFCTFHLRCCFSCANIAGLMMLCEVTDIQDGDLPNTLWWLTELQRLEKHSHQMWEVISAHSENIFSTAAFVLGPVCKTIWEFDFD